LAARNVDVKAFCAGEALCWNVYYHGARPNAEHLRRRQTGTGFVATVSAVLNDSAFVARR
jgi:hypothetical protein